MGAGQASAADMLSLSVGGYMENWIGYANRDEKGVDGGFDVQQDAEVHFSGSLESDMGLKFTVHVELEAANDSVSGLGADGDKSTDETEIDESFVRMSGEFGTLETRPARPDPCAHALCRRLRRGHRPERGRHPELGAGRLPGDRGLDDPRRQPERHLHHAAHQRRAGGRVLRAGREERELARRRAGAQ